MAHYEHEQIIKFILKISHLKKTLKYVKKII